MAEPGAAGGVRQQPCLIGDGLGPCERAEGNPGDLGECLGFFQAQRPGSLLDLPDHLLREGVARIPHQHGQFRLPQAGVLARLTALRADALIFGSDAFLFTVVHADDATSS